MRKSCPKVSFSMATVSALHDSVYSLATLVPAPIATLNIALIGPEPAFAKDTGMLPITATR